MTLEQHDYIHILLGRGLTLMDEAFVIGFTMGSTDRVSTREQNLFSFINQVLYPKPYRFTEDGMKVSPRRDRAGVCLGLPGARAGRFRADARPAAV